MPNNKRSQLLYEAKVYQILQGGTGIPKLYWHGTEGDCNIMAMELLGPSLDDLLSLCDGKFTLPTVLAIAEQMVYSVIHFTQIDRLECFHCKNFLHRDVKPDNFVIGRGSNANLIYIIDYGLAKRFRNASTKMHIPYKDGKRLTGTARYASLNTHMGIEQSRRDDLECLAYTLIYMLKGEVPWKGVRAANKQDKHDKILEIKKAVAIETLCKGMPQEFANFMHYCRSLKFEDKPDYLQLKRAFNDTYSRNKFYKSFAFDWKLLNVDLELLFDRTSSTDGSNKGGAEVKNEINEVKNEIKNELIEVKNEIKVIEEIKVVESKNMLNEPRGWATASPSPLLLHKVASIRQKRNFQLFQINKQSTIKHAFRRQESIKQMLMKQMPVKQESIKISDNGSKKSGEQTAKVIFVNKRIMEIKAEFVRKHTVPVSLFIPKEGCDSKGKLDSLSFRHCCAR